MGPVDAKARVSSPDAKAESVERMLRDGGWRFERLTDLTWRCHFRGKHGRFPIFIRVDTRLNFIHFAVVPYLRSPSDLEVASRLYLRLLELNQSLMMAKFAIDDDLDVILSVEYPFANLDPSELRDSLEALAHYADGHAQELATFR